MIKIFYGDNRVQAKDEIAKFLGSKYEVIDGADLKSEDLPNVFYGQSLLAAQRAILIRDLSENKLVYEQLPNYLSTPHKIVIFELKLDKRSATYKKIKDKIEIREFILPKDPNANLIFNIFTAAKHDGKKAIRMLENLKTATEPLMFFGLIVSQAIKDYGIRQGMKEKKVLKDLAKLDLKLKTTSIDPWLLIESFLLRLT